MFIPANVLNAHENRNLNNAIPFNTMKNLFFARQDQPFFYPNKLFKPHIINTTQFHCSFEYIFHSKTPSLIKESHNIISVSLSETVLSRHLLIV